MEVLAMMRKIMQENSSSSCSKDYTKVSTAQYRELLIVEMKRQGASDADLQAIKDSIIRNSIRSNRHPEDVAWAILQ